MAEFEANEIEGLSGPDSSASRESSNPPFFALSLDPGVRSSRRALEWVVFAGSLALHGVLYLRIHNDVTPQVTHFVQSKVEIELAHPPPPAEPKLKEPDPPPEPPRPAEAPTPHVVSRAPAAQAPAAQPDNSNLPASDEGLLPPTPPGTGTPGPAVAPPAPPAPAPPAPPPPPEPIVPARVGANYKNNPHPPYPRLAQREEWEGTAMLRVRVLASGRVGGVSLLKTSGHSVLDDAAIEGVKSWVFEPSTQGGKPVDGWATVPMTFTLQ